MWVILLCIFLLATFGGPLYYLISGKVDFQADYRTANRSSSNLAPDPTVTKEAVIQVYAARTFNWRGIFAVHTWVAVKPENEMHYIVCQVIGWLLFRNLPPLSVIQDIPDRHWFNQKPQILLDIRGQEATKLFPEIIRATESYPYADQYHYWPGPNSNTFTAHIARNVPALRLALPSDAIGKDYFVPFLARAPSGTGFQFSLYGLLGILVAWQEGIEINLLGLVYGVSPSMGIVKLPGFGDIPFIPRWFKS